MAIAGIVGSDATKFTPETMEKAKKLIRFYLKFYGSIVSGGNGSSGVDSWVIEEAKSIGKSFKEFLPSSQNWNDVKASNKLIVENSDLILCITVRELPASFPKKTGKYCNHCNTDEHVKSIGCWTAKYAREVGKEGKIIVVD